MQNEECVGCLYTGAGLFWRALWASFCGADPASPGVERVCETVGWESKPLSQSPAPLPAR